MSLQELAVAIRRLPLQERLMLLSVLTSSLHEELIYSDHDQNDPTLERLHGILKPDEPDNPSHADAQKTRVTEGYTDYLLEKYR